MNFKKTIAKSLVVAMALGMVPVANLQTAKAAPVITFKGAEGIATVTEAKYWGIAKEDKKGGKGSVEIGGKKYKITNVQDLVEMIDVYAALKGKAGIIAVGVKPTPDSSWVIKELAAADATFKVQFVASTGAVKGFNPTKALGGDSGYIFATTGKKGALTETDLKTDAEKVEVKLNDSSWQTFKAFIGADPTNELVNKKLKALGQSGSSLSFRIKGTDAAWASKESKLKIASQAKAPSVKVDITKETTSIKNGIEWQLADVGAAAVDTKWQLSTDKKGLALSALGLDASKAQDVLVRTAATVKKIVSKVGRVTLNKPAAALTLGTASKISGTGSAIKEAANELATVETTLAYDITKGATITNRSAKDIEYALVSVNGDNSKFKWNTLKASKDPAKKPTKATLKYSKTEKANTWTDGEKTKLFVRLAGTKQDKNNIATQSGVSAGAVLAFTPIAQKFIFTSGSTSDSTKSEITATNTTTAALKVTTGSAVTFTIKAKIEKLVNVKGGSPKVKVTSPLPKGVTYKVGKITDITTGAFEITVNISNKAFTNADGSITAAAAVLNLKYEGVDSDFKVTFEKKS